MIKRIIVFLCVLFPFYAWANTSDNYEIMVSTSSYNRLVFPVPFSQIVLPPDAQFAEDPIPLNNNLGLLVKPAQGARPITAFVQLIDGTAFNVTLLPSSKPEGAVFRYSGATDKNSAPSIEQRADDSWLTDLFVEVFQNKTPSGFEKRSKLTKPIKLVFSTKEKTKQAKVNQLDLIPVSYFHNSNYVVKVYLLKAKQATQIEPRDFYNEKVVAISLEKDFVSLSDNPKLIVLEYANE